MIHLDRKIINSVQIGDEIVVDSSKCVLKVISMDRYRLQKVSKCRTSKSSVKLANEQEQVQSFLSFLNNEDDNDYNGLYAKDDFKLFKNISSNGNTRKSSVLEIIKEQDENGGATDTFGLEMTVEDRIKQRQMKIDTDYRNIVEKHRPFPERIGVLNGFNRNTTSEYTYEDRQSIFSHRDMDSPKSTSGITSFKLGLIFEQSRKSTIRSFRVRSELTVNGSKPNNMIICEASQSGIIHKNKKVFLLGKDLVSSIGCNPVGVKDIVDIHKSQEYGINIITALVNNASNVIEIKDLLNSDTEHLYIFARIETSEAIYNFDSILEEADGIILDHGLLSSKISYEELCLVEMYIIEKCKINHKPVLLQTCILQSMTTRIRPKVTEISNIDYAVNMGVDGIILKEEVTMADNYVNIIKILFEILLNIETDTDTKTRYEELSKFYKIHKDFLSTQGFKTLVYFDTLFDCAVKSVFDVNADLVILYTDNFMFAKMLTKYHPGCRVVCVTHCKHISNYLRVIRGVTPFLIENFKINNDTLTPDEFDQLTRRIVANVSEMISHSNVILVVNAFTDNSQFKNGMHFVKIN